jgi:hypothetical protein
MNGSKRPKLTIVLLGYHLLKMSVNRHFRPVMRHVFCIASASADEHPALLQYLTKLGINHDIAHQYLSQIDFKAPQSAWGLLRP